MEFFQKNLTKGWSVPAAAGRDSGRRFPAYASDMFALVQAYCYK